MNRTEKEHAAESRMSWQKTSRARAGDEHFPRMRTLKNARNEEDYISFRGHFSIAGEELRWQNFHADDQRGQRGRRENMKVCVPLVSALIWHLETVQLIVFHAFLQGLFRFTRW